MYIRATLITDQQSTKSVQPSQLALGDPAIASEVFARLDPLARDSRNDPSSAKPAEVGNGPIPQITVYLGRAPPRTAGPTTYRCNAIDHRQERDDIRNVRGGEHRGREWIAVPVDDHMMLRAEFSAVRRVGAGRRAPLFAGACAESTAARDQSIAPARWSRSSSRWCMRLQTPACCQSRKRFQQVMPLQPSSCGRSCQGMPVRRTNTMPVKATRSGVLGRPRRDRRCGLGSSGSISAQSSSSISRRATHPTVRKTCPVRSGLSARWNKFRCSKESS